MTNKLDVHYRQQLEPERSVGRSGPALRAMFDQLDELTDAVNNLESTVYSCDEDYGDLCPDCWAETEPFIANLPDLSDEQLMALHDRVCSLLAEREEDDADCDCCDDGMCPDCYSQEFGDTDETITDEVQNVVDDVRGKNELRGSHKLPSSETYFITKDDGLLFEIVKMCVNNPDIRLGQALTNISGYRKVWGEDKDGELKDLWEWGNAKKGKKGLQS